MRTLSQRLRDAFYIKEFDLTKVVEPRRDPEARNKAILFFVGLILTPITLIGAIAGFKRVYWRFDAPLDRPPYLGNMRPITRVVMILGGIVIWVILYAFFEILLRLIFWLLPDRLALTSVPYIVLLFNLAITFIVMILFARWRAGIANYKAEVQRHGSARFARPDEIETYNDKKGFFIGGEHYYKKAGHLLTVAGTRGGKGVNLILPNLLMPRLFQGSWVVIDPKGENAAVSARIQREAGKRVVMLNPWEMLNLGNTSYNPLDLLQRDRMNFADDAQMIAECIVPVNIQKEAGGNNTEYFDNRARSYITGLLLHLMTSAPEQDRHLGTLWAWLRLESEEWNKLLVDMSESEDEHAGDIIRATGNEIMNLKLTSDREYGSIISSAQKWTDFIKSPALRDSLKTGEFTSANLQDSDTIVYVIIPADRLKTHNQWLRLIVSSLMRSIVRNPRKDVCFLLDEFYALGYLSEIDIALGSYAGYGIHVWAILQNLVQLQELYGRNWENFLSSCSVRHFFNVSDNTTAEYVSKMFGQTSIPTYSPMGELAGATPRALVNMDELRRSSGNIIYAVIDQLPPAQFDKQPYYTMNLPHDKNPYFKA